MSVTEKSGFLPSGTATVDESGSMTRQRNLSAIASTLREHRLGTVSAGVAIVWLAFWTANSTFLGVQNLWNMSVQIVPVGLLALGLVFVLVVREIDLSNAALSGVVATIAARITVDGGHPLYVAIIVAVLAAVAFMVLQAVIVVAGVPSLIVTLGGMIALAGALLTALPSTFAVNVAGTTFGNVGDYAFPAYAGWVIGTLMAASFGAIIVQSHRRASHQSSSRSRTVLTVAKCIAMLLLVTVAVEVFNRGGGLPLSVLVFVALLIGANWFLRNTSYGVHLYAVGDNRDAARRAGIRVKSIVVLSFAVLGVCAALSGLFSAAYVGGVSAASGPSSLVLDAIAAVVIGGVSLTGGKGSAFGALVGAVLIGSIADGVVLLGLATQVQDYVTAGMLVLAVSVDSFSFKKLFRK